MDCPTCDHTMESVGDVASRRVFWCPRCGTLKVETYTGVPEWFEEHEAPKLVERCREFEKLLVGSGMMTDVQPWRTLGIAESIHRPEDRPQGDPR